jgi:hypothetical protein
MNHFGFQQVIAYITFLPATKFARTAWNLLRTSSDLRLLCPALFDMFPELQSRASEIGRPNVDIAVHDTDTRWPPWPTSTDTLIRYWHRHCFQRQHGRSGGPRDVTWSPESLKLRCELFGIGWNILKLVADDDLQKVLLRTCKHVCLKSWK